ncbi:MAG: hypothetical protein HC869_24635 [Rhodospirillales bacterium]|nr:hypothetical protein [Rhodospirillales bacterium]
MTGIGGDCFAILMKPGQKKPIAFSAAGRAPAAATAAWYAAKGTQRASKPRTRACGNRAGRVDGWTRLPPGPRHDAVGAAPCAGHCAGRGRLRRGAARGGGLGERRAQVQVCRCQAQPAEGRQGAGGWRRDALSRPRQDPEADRQGRPRRFLHGRGRRGHGGRAQRPGRAAYAGGFCGPVLDLCDADCGELPRRRPV